MSRKKSEETRERILTSAIELFQTRGFAETTMREIAASAGVALGGTYYYFASKEAIVMAFYERSAEVVHEEVAAILSQPGKLETRVRAVLDARFAFFAPYRLFLGALFRHAADPLDPLSPFSQQTREIREKSIAEFAAALEGTKLPRDLAPHVAWLFWLYQMGLILFWIYDRSEEQRRTRRLLDLSLPLLVQLVDLARLPLVRPLRTRLVALLEEMRREPV